jgi:putative phosphonate catabolism associated alcohol dehydrogenase
MGKAVVFMGAGKPLELREFPVPDKLEAGAILVKTTLATVCGSDMHTWKGRRDFPTPSILGHEIVGRILKLGEGVDKDTLGRPISEGDCITWTIMSNCGTCYFCRMKGLPQKCLRLFKYGHVKSDQPPYFTGGFSEYVYVRNGTGIFKLPDDMLHEEAAPLMCAAATVTGGLEKIGVQFGDNIVIQGAGMLGLYAIAIAKKKGVKQVIVIDIIDKRLEMAKEFGADYTLNAKEDSHDNLVNKIKTLTEGWGADLVVEVTGNPKVIPLGVRLLRMGGRYLMHGSLYPGDTFTLDGHDIITKCLTIIGLHNYDVRHLGLALDFVYNNRNKFPFKKLVGPKFPLTVDGVTRALNALERREATRPAIVP